MSLVTAITRAAQPQVASAAMQILRQECISCHSAEKKKGGLLLTTREGLLQGGSSGAAIDTNKPASSLLLTVLGKNADPHMPPKKQLASREIRTLQRWASGGFQWDQAALEGEDSPRAVQLRPPPATYHPVSALALSPDGATLAAGRGRRLSLFDVSGTNFTLIHEQEIATDVVHSLAWSSDGRRILAGDFRILHLFDVRRRELESRLTNGLAGRITSIARHSEPDRYFIADGQAGGSGRIREISVPSGTIHASWKAHQDAVYDIDVSADGSRLATAGADRLVKIWETRTRRELATLEGHTAQVLAVAFNTNATQAASGAADRQLKIFDIQTREKIVSPGSSSAGVTAVRWASNGTAIFTGDDAGNLRRFTDLKSHSGEQSSATAQEKLLGTTPDSVLTLAINKEGTRVFAGSQDGSIHAWDREGKKLGATPPPRPPVTGTLGSGEPGSPAALSRALPENGRRGKAKSQKLTPGTIQKLHVWPEKIQLSSTQPAQQFIVHARTTEGFDLDVTEETSLSLAPGSQGLQVTAGQVGLKNSASGRGILKARFKNQEVSVSVETIAGTGSQVPSFNLDVLPILSRAGCNAGGCHAKGEGQNGFKLSVFSYDPRQDHNEILKEARGRRIFPAAPDESLLLLKPTGRVPHEGGVRLQKGSADYRLLERWIASGAPFGSTNEPQLLRIEAFPAQGRYHKQAVQRIGVMAHYSDGSQRDVTRLAAFDSNDKEIAKVRDGAFFEIGTLPGQAVVVARYMGFVADSQIMVPADQLLPPVKYAGLKRVNFIDEKAYEHFQKLGLHPSEPCTDAEFLRRAKLDAIGLLPTAEEVRAFLADKSPDKRQRLIETVLEDPAYADYWANKWADLVRPNPDRVGVKSVFTLDQWLRESFRKNTPYDQFVRSILLARGSNHRDGPAVVYRDRREPSELTTMFSQLFLGVRMECAKCHHHPNEKWSQDDFYQFAAFFGPVKQKGAGLSPPISAGMETFYFAPGGTVKHPVTGAVMKPRPLDANPVEIAESSDPREALADWLTSPANPYFAKAAVNRVWAAFFGRGLVEPVDDFRISNPCVNPGLLEALASDFSKSGHDLKHLMRRIMSSNLYQLSSTPNDTNLSDTRNFSRSYRRRLPAEVLLDAVTDVTGVPDTMNAVPQGGRAVQAWSYKIESQFMDAFGRPNASSDCPCERDRQLSVVQSLHLMNSKSLQSKLSSPSGRVRKLASSSLAPGDIIDELYLSALGRFPNTSERTGALKAFTADGATRETATEDILWALLNSPEFVLNH